MDDTLPEINDYSIDDSSIKNILSEIFADEESSLRSYLTRISELLESVESHELNTLGNFLLYGMLINDGTTFEPLFYVRDSLSGYLEEYHQSLDKIEEFLALNEKLEVDNLSQFIDSLYCDNDYQKKNIKEVEAVFEFVPDIKSNLEALTRSILSGV